MHIDWFVFFAQIVNFLILLFLLKRFLFGRILGAMDSREAKLAVLFAEAEQSRTEARASAAQQEQRMRELELTSEALVSKVRADADAYRRQLMEEVRREIDGIQSRWVETLCLERASLFGELRRLTGVEVYAIARQVLKDLAGVALEERIAEVLARRIESLGEAEREKIRSLTVTGEPIRIFSAFALPPGSRARLDEAIERGLGLGLAGVQYEAAEDVLSGCEMRIDGYKIAWSVKDYLDTLEEKFHLCLYREAREETAASPKGGTHGEGTAGGRGSLHS